MREIYVFLSLIALLLIATGNSRWVMAQEKICAEDFSNDTIMGETGILDTFEANNEAPYATIFSANDRRLDNGLNSGLWGAYTGVGGIVDFMGYELKVGTISLMRGPDSPFDKSPAAELGYVVFMVDSANRQDESGNYIYSYSPGNKIDLSGDEARIEWDACDKSGQNNDGSMRILLRASGSWILSSVVPVSIANSWANAAVASVQPNALSWQYITSPSDATLTALASNDEAPLVPGEAVSTDSLLTLLKDVDGFGLVLATDLVGPTAMPLAAIYLDAVHLRGKGGLPTSASYWTLYY